MANIKKLLFFSLSIYILASSNIKGQSKIIDKVELVQNFQLGTKYQFELQKGKIDSRKPGTENIIGITEVEFNVISQKKDFKECSWKYGATKVIGINPEKIDEQTRKLMNFSQGSEVKFTIDNNGTFQEIINFEECRIQIENCINLIYENGLRKGTPEKMEALKASYETPEILVSTYHPGLIVFFTMFGATIIPDSVYVSKSDLPNPFGGRSFPTDVTIKIESLKDNIALISVKETIPSRDLYLIMMETFIELFKLSDKPFNENEIPKIKL